MHEISHNQNETKFPLYIQKAWLLLLYLNSFFSSLQLYDFSFFQIRRNLFADFNCLVLLAVIKLFVSTICTTFTPPNDNKRKIIRYKYRKL